MATVDFKKRVASLQNTANQTLTSINVLLKYPGREQIDIIENEASDFIQYLIKALWSMQNDLQDLLNDKSTASRLRNLTTDSPDSIDYLNALVELAGNKSFSDILEEGIFEVLSAGRLFDKLNLDEPKSIGYQELLFKINHADTICRKGLNTLSNYIQLLESLDKSASLPRLNPTIKLLLKESNSFMLKKKILSPEFIEALQNKALEKDIFHYGTAFRYIDNEFIPVRLTAIRKVNEFYGYKETRDTFRQFFNNFAKGRDNHPLLITSLPGLGKTHITIAYTLSHENMTLILPEPGDLDNNLERLIRSLSRRKQNRFVLFFDDVDTRNIDWYYFRTHVGGSFSLPDNITIVIASNYDFPANISSRGRGLRFPTFDEIICQEMISDFLKSFGMKSPRPELVSVIAADYVEEFGQKVFEELSPRTLVRYLERYNNNQYKRKRTLELSREDLITKPDPQIFHEVNVKLMRSLYGDDVIQQLLKEKYDIYDDETIL